MSMLGISIVNYFGADDVAELVHTVLARHAGSDLPVAVAIVDNSDQRQELDEVAEQARRHGLTSRVFHGHGNVGYAAGNNLAARWLLEIGAEVIWVLNPDTRVVGGALSCALDVLDVGDRVIAATSSGTDRAGPADLGALDLWTGRSGHPPSDGQVSTRRLCYVAGHSMIITAKAYEELAGFSEDFFLFYEEADLAVRAAQLGIPLTAVPDLRVAHAGGAATGATSDLRAKSLVTYFHASRSCMIFFRKHHRHRVPLVAAARLGYAAKALLVAGPAAGAAVVRGTVAGLRA
ncbi:glycosyltransferase [Micromonospora gifhornensis]|uniref:Glycosyl transferase n=1 Tax=Micromonospora gifhornensis TaxID=84594 RepID=A0ABQ4IGI8_9ACTN|nr:glycosyltransferase family 2 protein [Micromonospora gifhornensis]GIJ16987.1 glycosyl transferase [Micromonospora gifhornensis]